MLQKYLLTLNFFLCLSNAFAQLPQDSLTAAILNLRMEATNPGLQDEQLLHPLFHEIKRIFRVKGTGFLHDVKIHWATFENPFNTVKKLNKEDREKLTNDSADLFMKIEVLFQYNDLLGGIIPKGKRHALKFKCAVFDRTGDRIWFVRKKVSNGFELGVDEDEVDERSDLPPDEFMILYTEALRETFGKF